MHDGALSEAISEIGFGSSVGPKVRCAGREDADKGREEAAEEAADAFCAGDVASDGEGPLRSEGYFGPALGGLEMSFYYFHWTGYCRREGAGDTTSDQRGKLLLVA